MNKLQEIARQLRTAGASLPAPKNKGTPESALVNGLSIALLLVENAIKDELAKSDAEPVAWQNKLKPFEFYEYEQLDPLWHNEFTPLYTSPPQPKPLTPSEWWDAAPWQPMETAPKDGAEILAYHIDGKKPHLIYWTRRNSIVMHWSSSLNDHYHTTDAFYSGWLPLPEQK